eukprot:gnl/TRDRNA2_/TRDRNA2_154346_c0_seq3.p1 gnl/TRDRNA2_/TRDRNA2_154346_c0~~gnl/TRDRNA2_/TRDRNA2_154346_c0_seq3.p1  ORF type:complete len:788 (+),score=204.71 gnl/TRDRNA2_/TRDRNA2_154346_c0_seq3:90-2366(+)
MASDDFMLGDLYSKCVQMVNENKVSTKNAFDVKLIDHMDEVVDSFMGVPKSSGNKRASTGGTKDRDDRRASKAAEKAATEEAAAMESDFTKASCTIEASARIYAYRVDSVHMDTYKVLGGLSSADQDDEDKEGEDGAKGVKRRRIVGVNTLERNEKNIEQSTIEADEQSDPMFRRMAAAFDAGGAKGLLLSHLPIAEDLSLVFNGDVPLARASCIAPELFSKQTNPALKVGDLGLGAPSAAKTRLAGAKLCPEIDGFRRQLWGNVKMDVSLPDSLEQLLGPAMAACTSTDNNLVAAGGPKALGPPAAAPPLPDSGFDNDFPDMGGDDGFAAGGGGDNEMMPIQDDTAPGVLPGLEGPGRLRQSMAGVMPLTDMDESIVAAGPYGRGSEEASAFDELFKQFCGTGASTTQFNYFDDCWAKLVSEKQGKDSKDEKVQAATGAEGQLVLADGEDRKVKRPLFDLAGLDKPVKPIEMEPAHKHQLSERAAQWQLHKDVPPYMVDRITMPSWPTWSRSDFACLGLRPHLMLKLVRKSQPPGDGPHDFSDLFNTVVVENPEAFPWLATTARGSSMEERPDDGDDEARAERDLNDDDDDFDASGLPAHLDVDPQELFLRAEDNVVPTCDDGGDMDMQGMGPEEDDYGADLTQGLDFGLVDQPTKVGKCDIGYSRNSKFVDVKLVKKHLLDCIDEELKKAESAKEKGTSMDFQGLISRTVSRMPASEMENLSVQVAFICALHICNEKGLELDQQEKLGRFNMVKPA